MKRQVMDRKNAPGRKKGVESERKRQARVIRLVTRNGVLYSWSKRLSAYHLRG